MGGNVKGTNSDVENPAEKIDRKVMSAPNWITKIKKIFDDVLQGKIFDVHQGPYLQMWNSIFVISCVFAVSLDPLFFYVVNVHQDEKCLRTDEKLRIVALVMRTLTDVIFLVHLICEILDSVQKTKEKNEEVKQTRGNSSKKWEARELIQNARKIAQNMSWLSVIIDVLALVPLPQLIILMFYPKEGSGFVENTMFVNVFLLGQYVPRIFRIHLSAKAFKMMNGIWPKGLFNLFLYILAGHVLGAFWYFFSIQREASCWHDACVKLTYECTGTFCVGCKDTLYCDSRHPTRNISYLNKSCPLDTPDDALSPFDFGIFLDSLKNENPDQKFGVKFLYSFWWGLRNLSNFGTNLETSTFSWEILFAIFISVTGLLLFLYLIGNVQAFMQMEATKKEEMRRQGRKTTKTEEMRRQGIKTEEATKTEEMRRQGIKTEEAIKTLKEIPMLKDMDEKVLKMMCDYLKPATYSENSFIFRTGDPLDCMLLIIEGTMWTYASSDSHAGQGISSMGIKPLRKGDFYGEELLDWASDFTKVPVSSKHVKCHTKVKAFVLMAEDLGTVVSPRPHGDLLNRNNAEEVKATLSAALRSHTKAAQRLPPPSLAEIGDDNSEN
ncbi:unnamed protein product [Malus baccata var. baccata]